MQRTLAPAIGVRLLAAGATDQLRRKRCTLGESCASELRC